MSRTSILLGLVILCGCLVVTVDGQTGTKKEGGTTPGKQLQVPSGWGKLGLSADQKKKIYATRADYSGKINKLHEQISALKKEEHLELVKLLTEDQKKQLRKLALDKVPEVKEKEKDK